MPHTDLPPCAPELNPVELVWRELRQRYLTNRVDPDATQLEDAVGCAWNRLAKDFPRLRSLTHYPWIRAAQQAASTKGI
jgi:transposase